MSKILGILLLVGLGGVALWYFSRGKAQGDTGGEWIDTPDGGKIFVDEGGYSEPAKVTVNGQTFTFDEPGTYVIRPEDYLVNYGEEFDEAYGDRTPEQIPLPAIGTPENPLRTVIPEPMIPHTGTGSWYEIRNIEEQFNLTPEQFQEEIAVIRETPGSERTARQEVIGGYSESMEQAQNKIDFRTMVERTGGQYVGGILVPPESWTGSVTAYAQEVRRTLDG